MERPVLGRELRNTGSTNLIYSKEEVLMYVRFLVDFIEVIKVR
jgi:hypothetical protein